MTTQKLDAAAEERSEEPSSINIPGDWKVGEMTFHLAAPHLSDAIRWQMAFQDSKAVDIEEAMPDLAMAAAGLCCPALPTRKRREAWHEYGDRVFADLHRQTSAAPIDIYNSASIIFNSLRAWLNTGNSVEDQKDTESLGNG